MRIAVIGAGALGCLFGLHLQRSGQSVLLIHHRSSVVAAIRRKGVTVREPSGRILKNHIAIKSSLSRRDAPDIILLTVKAYDTEDAVRSLQSACFKAPVLSLQNGLGNIEILRRLLPKQVILAGTTTEGAQAVGPGLVNHTGKGTTWIGGAFGGLTRQILDLKNMLRRAGFKAETSSNILGAIWSKAIVNSAINPISALAGVTNGEILRIPVLMGLALKVVDEGVLVARAGRLALKPRPDSMLASILQSTSANKSSMLQDLEAGRMTEIRQLNGRISDVGTELKIATPYNDALTALILGLEATTSASRIHKSDTRFAQNEP